jgi:type VI secretion system protein VasD
MALLSSILLVGCATQNQRQATMHMSAAHYLNPSIAGGAEPITVDFYVLKTPVAFKSANYFQLTQNTAAVLGDQLIDKQSVEVRPDQHFDHALFLPPNVHYIGITAGYRNINQSKWRAVITVPVHKDKKLSVLKSNQNVNVDVVLQSQELHAQLLDSGKHLL